LNNSIKITILTALTISLTTTVSILKVQSVSAFVGPSCQNCAKDFAPGQEAKSPGDAQNLAPGQKAVVPGWDPNGAPKYAPGQEKQITK
jgi:hypothetical protein